MDNTPDSQEATSSTSSSNRVVRSSARVRAAKVKGKGKDSDPESISTRITRSVKGKDPIDSETPRKNPRRSTAALSINEPPKDHKGKKRAIEPPSDEEPSASASSTSKRLRTLSSYSLRSLGTAPDPSPRMPRKTRTTPVKSKVVTKANMALPGPSRLADDSDVDMADPASPHDSDHADPDHVMDDAPLPESHNAGEETHHEDDDDGGSDEDNEDDGGNMNDGPGIPGGMDEATALAMFGDYRQFGSFMMSLSSRLKTMLNNIKKTADPTTRLLALQELSELLSISTEDTLAGSFQVEQFVAELVKILGGRGTEEDEDDDGGDDDQEPKDEDAALAAAIAMSTGASQFQGDENPEAQVLACRCLANLMEALPGVAHTVVYHGAIPVLCSKLLEISYIDLAEQTLSVCHLFSSVIRVFFTLLESRHSKRYPKSFPVLSCARAG